MGFRETGKSAKQKRVFAMLQKERGEGVKEEGNKGVEDGAISK